MQNFPSMARLCYQKSLDAQYGATIYGGKSFGLASKIETRGKVFKLYCDKFWQHFPSEISIYFPVPSELSTIQLV